ncbi:MAG: hypothetical protein M3119_00525, partial [Verrucomicrobiota bacterium]|nr:hypothetical protein [Verrucomicrobiota bacterium]
GAAGPEEACTNIIEELSPRFVAVGDAAGFAAGLGAGLVCAYENVIAQSNAAAPPRDCFRLVGISMKD